MGDGQPPYGNPPYGNPDRDSYTIPYRVQQLEGAVNRHGNRIDSMEDRWLRLDGAFSLMKLTIGTSIVSSVVAIISLLALLSGRAS